MKELIQTNKKSISTTGSETKIGYRIKGSPKIDYRLNDPPIRQIREELPDGRVFVLIMAVLLGSGLAWFTEFKGVDYLISFPPTVILLYLLAKQEGVL